MIKRAATGFIGALTVACVLLAHYALWFDEHVFTTSGYLSTVTPMAADPQLQRALAAHLTDSIYDQVSDQLGQIDADVARRAQANLLEVRPEVAAAAARVVAGEAFATVWLQANRSFHDAVISPGPDAGAASGGARLVLDFRPVQDDVIALVEEELPPEIAAGVTMSIAPIVISVNSDLAGVASGLRYERLTLLLLGVGAVLLGFVCVTLARKPALAVIKICAALLIAAAVSFVLIGWLVPAAVDWPGDAVDQAGAQAIYVLLTRELQVQTLWLGLAAVLVALAAATARRRLS